MAEPIDPGSAPRIAALDVGTNTIRCIVVQAAARGLFRVLDDEKATVRLGEGLAATGKISSAAWDRAREALLRMKQIAEGLGATTLAAVATSAVRKADNGGEFVAAMERETGVAIRVISGEDEAELAALSALHQFDMDGTRYAMVDIGGGSVEIVTALGHHIDEVHSLDLGAVFLTETFLLRDPPGDKELQGLDRHVRKALKRVIGPERFVPQVLIGSGGTITTLGSLVQSLRRERYDTVHGYEILHSEVVHVLTMLRRKTVAERAALPGVSPERAQILVAGVAVVDRLMRGFGVNVLRINERGIREGLILQTLRQLGHIPGASPARNWRTSVEELALACHVDLRHSRHVAQLALQLFDVLADDPDLLPRTRDLLEAATLLHDVGYFIAYAKHHKHSYHLIRHATLFNFSPREKELIANVARYHRGSLPKKKHEPFAQLNREDQRLVRKLGALLRLADGLDRRRGQLVQSIRAERTAGRMSLFLDGSGDVSVEVHGGRVRGDLFEQAFGMELWVGARDPGKQPRQVAG